MTTALAIVRAAIPDATPRIAQSILWERTCFPCGRVTARELYRAASRERRSFANGITLCDFCDRKAEPDRFTCRRCDRVFTRKEEA